MVARSVGTRRRKTSCHACGVSSFRSLPRQFSRAVALVYR